MLVGFGLSQVAGLITTMYLHRTLSHKALWLSPVMTMIMRVGTWMFTIVSPREWVAVHRKHHNFSDVEGDPHSPHIEGYWQIMIANVYYYKREARNDDTLEKYAADLPYDRFDKMLFRYPEAGFIFTGALLVLLMGFGPGLVAYSVHTVLYIVLNAAINGRATPSATRTSPTTRPTSSSWRSSLPARACTTTTMPARPRPSSPPSAASSTRRGPSSGCWRSSGSSRFSPRWTRAGMTTAAASPKRS